MKRNFFLENGIYCKGEYDNFKLYYSKVELTPICNNISYIPKTLIALKSERTVYVYEPLIVNVEGKPVLQEIARFESKSPNAYLKVIVQNKGYIIDSNIQITLCNCKRLT